MSGEGGNAPSWLFSFVDLAFLSMIAMTQLASDISEPTPDLGEMVVPRIGAEATTQLATGASDLWQLRVHPPSTEYDSPFELVHTQAGERVDDSPLAEEGNLGDPALAAADLESDRLSVERLRERLKELRDTLGRKPLLAPHEDSRSQDFLTAAGVIEEFWPSRRRSLVAKNFDER